MTGKVSTKVEVFQIVRMDQETVFICAATGNDRENMPRMWEDVFTSGRCTILA